MNQYSIYCNAFILGVSCPPDRGLPSAKQAQAEYDEQAPQSPDPDEAEGWCF